jgi:hypothetical protein
LMRMGAFSSVNRCGPILGLGCYVSGAGCGVGDLGCFGARGMKL